MEGRIGLAGVKVPMGLMVRVFVAFILVLPAYAAAANLVVWLVPLVRDDSTGYVASQQQLAAFNEEFGVANAITVLNTTVPVLRDQLFVRNPESAEPNWPTIISQRQTLTALKRFATEQKITLDVRFIKWERMFSALNEALLGNNVASRIQPPDVVQIGSTWKAYFNTYAGKAQGGKRGKKVSVPYTYDLRLLFYWRRLPGVDEEPAVILSGDTWDKLFTEFHQYQRVSTQTTRAFLAMPIGLTLNVIHDYAPLVWGGGSAFLHNNKIDLTSTQALKLPLLLARRASMSSTNNHESVRVVGFPEVGHVEGIEYFLSAKYRAIIEPVGFLKHWQKMFYKLYHRESSEGEGNQVAMGEFIDYVGVLPLPVTFQGGSELMVTNQAGNSTLAAAFVNFLVSDTIHLHHLAQNGYLPAELPGFGIDVLLSSLGIPKEKQRQIKQVLNQAWLNRRSYPALADWPNKVETLENMEAMQRLWRRIAQGNDDGLARVRITDAAAQAQYTINRHINPFIQLWDSSLRIWPVLAGFILLFLVSVLLFMHNASRRQRGQILALLLFRGKYHSTLSAYGATVIDFLELPYASLQEKLMQYGSHIAEHYNHHIANMVKNVCLDLSGKSEAINLYAIAQQASDGAKMEYFAATAREAPLGEMCIDDTLKQLSLPYLGNILALILQEWLFNTYKNAETGKPVTINIHAVDGYRQARLIITSNVPLSSDHCRRLMSKPSPIKDIDNWARSRQVSGQGLSLIRDLLWYSFKSRVLVNSSHRTEFEIAIPVKHRS